MVDLHIPAGVTQHISSSVVRALAAKVGFDLAGIAAAGPAPDFERFQSWAERGFAGEMRYLTDHRAALRKTVDTLLPEAKTVIAVGLNYNGPEPYSIDFNDAERAWISRYAWGGDYHDRVRAKLTQLAHRLLEIENFEWRACIDTAPLLERSLARQAGLGWVGKNTCLINQQQGSWFFLGELLTTLDLASDQPPPDRCGSCSRCIDACPTAAIIPAPNGGFELDARLCISYFTIELRGAIPEEHRSAMGHQIFGCDICQDVCPWNRKALQTRPAAVEFAPPLERMASLDEASFRALFRDTPVTRAKYSGFLRNVAVAMGNSALPKFREPLERLAKSSDGMVAEHAVWALRELRRAERRSVTETSGAC